MQEMIEIIRAAVASDATSDQKAAGLQACRAIAAALDTEPGKPLVLPGTPSNAPPAARLSLDQVLEMFIAKLTVIASERDKSPAQALPPPSGLRVPIAPVALPRGVQRPTAKPTTARKAPSTSKP